jgi:hypothetical protein
VTSHPQGSVFHHSAWLRVLEAEYGQPPLGIACESPTGDLVGVLPLMLTRGLPLRRQGHLGGRRLSSLPRTPTAGPLAADPRAAGALVRAAIDRVLALGDARLQLKVQGPSAEGLTGLVGMPWRPSYALNLPRSRAEIRFGNARNHARIKWAVNKAAKSNVRVRPAQTERDLRNWYQLYLLTMRSHAVPPRSLRLFQAIWSALRPLGFMELALAERVEGNDRTLVAGSVFLKFAGTVFYAFNGSRREDLSLRPNDLIMWHAIHEAAEEGYRRFDLGEVDPTNVTLADFKKKWGTSETWLHRYYYPTAGTSVRSSIDGYPLTIARAVWRHLPLAGTAMLGDRIYSYL